MFVKQRDYGEPTVGVNSRRLQNRSSIFKRLPSCRLSNAFTRGFKAPAIVPEALPNTKRDRYKQSRLEGTVCTKVMGLIPALFRLRGLCMSSHACARVLSESITSPHISPNPCRESCIVHNNSAFIPFLCPVWLRAAPIRLRLSIHKLQLFAFHPVKDIRRVRRAGRLAGFTWRRSLSEAARRGALEVAVHMNVACTLLFWPGAVRGFFELWKRCQGPCVRKHTRTGIVI